MTSDDNAADAPAADETETTQTAAAAPLETAAPAPEPEPAPEPVKLSRADAMKAKVRTVLEAQPFRGPIVHKDDLLAVVDALIDGPDEG